MLEKLCYFLLVFISWEGRRSEKTHTAPCTRCLHSQVLSQLSGIVGPLPHWQEPCGTADNVHITGRGAVHYCAGPACIPPLTVTAAVTSPAMNELTAESQTLVRNNWMTRTPEPRPQPSSFSAVPVQSPPLRFT